MSKPAWKHRKLACKATIICKIATRTIARPFTALCCDIVALESTK
jgi:hypothetical protein